MSARSNKSIEHKGFIDRITDNKIYVRIISESACSACHAKGACTAADMSEKEIIVQSDSGTFSTGEQVNLVMEQALGFKAIMIGYINPFLILFVSLLIASGLGIKELTAGLISLGLVPVYYFFVFLFREKINQNFSFSIRKIE